MQSQGKSTQAICQFQSAYETAKKEGESLSRLKLIEDLFFWYRTYGSHFCLFSKNPQGHDQIIGEYRPKLAKKISYQSEWGKDPDQAATIREFMLGVAETLSGIFCVSVGAGLTAGGGLVLLYDGPRRIFLSLNRLWTEHEKGMIALKEWEHKVEKTLNSN
jgi:hypothetical protein